MFAIWRDAACSSVFLMAALGPLLAWAFRLPTPGHYVIPPFLLVVIDVLLLCFTYGRVAVHVSGGFLLMAPLVAYPVIAVRNADRRRKARPPASSPDSSAPA
jgi:hypothetical protein